MPHKPKGTDQTAKCGKMWPIKRKQGEKCYFSPCALKSQLTNSCLPFLLSVAVQNSTRVSVRRLFFQICAVWVGLSLGAVWLNATLAQRDRPDGQMWKNVAPQTQTRGKMLFFPLCVKIATYQQLLSLMATAVWRTTPPTPPTNPPSAPSPLPAPSN